MLERPRLPRSLFVAPDRQHDDIGFAGHLHGLADGLTVFFRVAWHHFILIPGTAYGNLAALAKENPGAMADFLLNAFEHGNIVFRYAAVSA